MPGHMILTLDIRMTDKQIADAYETAERMKVGLNLYGATPSPERDSFTWQITGSIRRVLRFSRYMKGLR